MTILVPTLIICMYGLMGYLIAKGDEMGDVKTVHVVDENGLFKGKLKGSTVIKFSYSDKSYEEEKKDMLEDEEAYLLHIPASVTGVQIIGQKKASASLISNVENQVNEIIKNKKLLDAGIDIKILEEAEKGINISSKQITAEGEKDAGTIAAYIIGFLTAILIYMSLFIYGTQVMRGVIEEKTSRVIEVVISSVKPFQLMMGKIIGVGMVGLTQFALWIVLSITLTGTLGPAMMGGKMKGLAKTEQVSGAQINTGVNGNPAVAAAVSESDNQGAEIL